MNKQLEEISELLFQLRNEGRRILHKVHLPHDCEHCNNSGITGYNVDLREPVICRCMRGKLIQKIIIKGRASGYPPYSPTEALPALTEKQKDV